MEPKWGSVGQQGGTQTTGAGTRHLQEVRKEGNDVGAPFPSEIGKLNPNFRMDAYGCVWIRMDTYQVLYGLPVNPKTPMRP